MTATFAAVLARYRRAAKLRPQELAERAGLSPSLISRLEANHREPGAETVKLIADALGLEEGTKERDELLLAAGYRPGSAAALLSCPALHPLDVAWLDADQETRGWLEVGIGLLVDGALARKPMPRVVAMRTPDRRETA